MGVGEKQLIAPMRIVVISQHFWPESFGAGVIIDELARKLNQYGHEVVVLTGMPNYPDGQISPPYRGKLWMTENRDGVKVVRNWFLPTSRFAHPLLRGAGALMYGLVTQMAGLFLKKGDVILSFSPPIFMGRAAKRLGQIWRVPVAINVKDLFTRSILAGGLARPGLLTRLLLRMEQSLYRHANLIITNASNFQQYFENLGVPEDRIVEIPDWADGEFIQPMDKDNEVRASWGLQGKFVVVYSGNMGHFSDLDTLIDTAEILKDDPRFAFVLVGGGVKQPALVAKAAERGLTNVQFRPLQERDMLPKVLGAADIATVTLSAEGGEVSTQGKLYSILAAGRPVLAITPRDNDIKQIVEEAEIGTWVPNGEATTLARKLQRFLMDNRSLLNAGKKARDLFDEKYSLDVCAREFESALAAVVAEYRQPAHSEKEESG